MLVEIMSQGRPKYLVGGGICMSRSDMLRMKKYQAMCVAWGFGGMLPRKIFLKRCNLVCFRVYFDQILSLFFFKNTIFLYKKNNILDTLLLWGISHEEIFENMLLLLRFGVYLETFRKEMDNISITFLCTLSKMF